MRIDNGIFWGVFLALIGLLIIIKYTLNLNISIFRVAVAIIFIYLGISLILGQWGIKTESDIIFREERITSTSLSREYNVVFSRGYIDLSNISPEELNKNIKIATVFSSTTLKLNPNMPVVIDIDCAFGSVKTPDGKTLAFGKSTYNSPEVEGSQNYLKIKADTVFGELNIIY